MKEKAVQLRQSGQRMAYLSICVLKDGEELRPAHIEAFRNQFMKRVSRKMVETSELGTCAFCGRCGYVSATVNEAFKFATFDKPGFCPSLRKQDATKVLPICSECMTYLKNGANRIMKNLSLDFLNVKLWIIPSLLRRDDGLLEKVVKSIESTVGEYRDFARNETRIVRALSQIDEQVFYDFVFVSIKQSQQRIELHLTQISPTRLKLLVDASKRVGERQTLNENELPTVERMWHLYQKPARRTLAGKNYFALVRSVFHGENYSYQRFLWHCMDTLRKTVFSGDEKNKLSATRSLARQIFACVLYLNSIDVFNFREVKGDVSENFAERFFEKFPEFFNHPWKKAVFLTGVLTGKLLSIQYAKRQATPFFNKLKGLKMNIRDVQALVPEIRNKLQQYGAFGNWAQELIRLIGHYYMLCGDCKVGIDELNFVFTLGMAYSNGENFTVKEDENA
ncbi:TIGR02556 family CRISPR-associated protein [Thermotoga sp. Ku-13t]|uniref:TIGR02556 family CRISPR-associated protein n=1 Tax=Thermotoga sp. Ku-13t TaxID=1755813 RepID=UPI001F497785|nr:TIGR02556 family CRISPR-associated protein [Thermotoga sp. Ku-13t]